MSAEAQMQLLGEHDGARWYWAAPGMFHLPGVYYWDGDDNVRVEKAQPAPSPQAPGRRQGPPGITLEPQGHDQPAVPVVSDERLLLEWDRVSHIAEAGSRRLAFARAILALRPQAVPMTLDHIWANDGIMSANGIIGFKFDAVIRIVRAVEAHHGITAKAEGGA